MHTQTIKGNLQETNTYITRKYVIKGAEVRLCDKDRNFTSQSHSHTHIYITQVHEDTRTTD